ncbi:MAG TPA: aldo/keto reductase [Fimbriimonadaceae bacterium]|jgi:aryl-alcohol dehydrogenase-like predicted oxidoreductase
METRKIGSLDVTVVGLGCNNFGGRLDVEQTRAVVDGAIDSGINFFDTADIYGKTKSETFLGEVLKGRRDKIILATKFGMEIDENHKGARPEYVLQAAEDSLSRLQTDHIDLYQLHQPDPGVPIAETLGALDKLVQQGKVRQIGCSNFNAAQLQESKNGTKGAHFVSVQNEYSMLQREPEVEVLDECQREHLAFLPYFPLASGLLSGKYRKNRPLPEGTRIQEGSKWLTPENLDKVEQLVAYADSQGHTILELAFSWLLSKEVVSSVIAGATKPEQIQKNAAAGEWKLSEHQKAQVDEILG